jgi:uncharacterized protein
VILVDANLLLYAYNLSSDKQDAARRWLEDAFARAQPVRFAWATLLAFLRISTHHRAFPNALSLADAVGIVEQWLEEPGAGVLDPSEQHWALLRKLLTSSQSRGPLVMDAHLAALAIEHGATLCSTDQDFARFPGLRWFNPLRN